MEERGPLKGGHEDEHSISLTSVSDSTVYSAFSETEQPLDDTLYSGLGAGKKGTGVLNKGEIQDPPIPPSSLTPTATPAATAKRKRGRPKAPDANKKLAALEALFSEPVIPTRRKSASTPATGRLSLTTKAALPSQDVYDPLIEEFHRACQYGQVGLIESLLRKQGVPVDFPRLDTGDTGLHLAATHQQSEAVKTLLKAGANVQALNFLRHQPRELCPPGSVTYRLLADFEEMQTGSESSSSSSLTSRDGQGGGALLLRAVWRGQEAQVREILRDEKVNPNITDSVSGSSALHYAATWNYASLIEILLSRGANPTLKRPSDGATALHLACRFSSGNAVRVLLASEAAWDTLDSLGRTPVDYSSKSVRRVIRKYAREHLRGEEATRLLDATATQRFIEVSADDEGGASSSGGGGGGGLASSEQGAEGGLKNHHSLLVPVEGMSAREEKKLLQMMAIISKSTSGTSLATTKKRRGRPPRHNHLTGSTGAALRDELQEGGERKVYADETGVKGENRDEDEPGGRGENGGNDETRDGHGRRHEGGKRRRDQDGDEEEDEDEAEALVNDAAGALSAPLEVRQSPRYRAAARTLTSLFDDAKSMISGASSILLREIEAMEPLLQLHCGDMGSVTPTTTTTAVTDDTHSLWFFLAPQVEDLYTKSFPGRGRLRSRIPLSKTRSLTGAEQQTLLDASLVDKFTGLRAHLEGPLGSLSLLERDAVLGQFERAGGNLANVPIIYVDLPRLAHRDEGLSSTGPTARMVGEAGALPPKLKLKYKQRRSIVDLYT